MGCGPSKDEPGKKSKGTAPIAGNYRFNRLEKTSKKKQIKEEAKSPVADDKENDIGVKIDSQDDPKSESAAIPPADASKKELVAPPINVLSENQSLSKKPEVDARKGSDNEKPQKSFTVPPVELAKLKEIFGHIEIEAGMSSVRQAVLA